MRRLLGVRMNGRPMGSVDAEETFRVRDKARRLNFKMRREKNLIIFTCLKIVKHGCNAAHSSQFHRHRLMYNGFIIYMVFQSLTPWCVVKGWTVTPQITKQGETEHA